MQVTKLMRRAQQIALLPQGLPLVRVQSNSHGAHRDILLWGSSCLQALHHSLRQKILILCSKHLGANQGRKTMVGGRQYMYAM